MLALSLAWAGLAPAKPLVSVMTTCARLGLNQGAYPADTVTWFDANKDNQVVFFAHLLFPLNKGAGTAAWHPPLRADSANPGEAAQETLFISGRHTAEVEWLDPEDKQVALYHVTLPARSSADLLRVGGEDYLPHTVAMAIGLRDLRPAAGQLHTLEVAGQYKIRLKVDREPLGLTFFRVIKGAAEPRSPAVPLPLSGTVTP